MNLYAQNDYNMLKYNNNNNNNNNKILFEICLNKHKKN